MLQQSRTWGGEPVSHGNDADGAKWQTLDVRVRSRRHPGDVPDTGPTVPAYRVHKAKRLGYVRLDGRMVYLGRANSPDSFTKYHRTVLQWLATGRTPGDLKRSPEQMTVARLVDAYLAWARTAP
ncbi:MAG TPA: hypothetical protein VGN72_09555 [Tepidisphaeraceae bacterium]|jgi:hypothetical protein|nr:hypothetical protein [Tepidisphaeraceae bacterium]